MKVRLLDSVVALEAPDDLLEPLRGLYAASLCADPSPVTATVTVEHANGVWQVLGAGLRTSAADRAQAFELVVAAVNHAVVDQCASVAVHAGVVARGGRVLALPGPSGAGKSTLTAALLRSGWDYVSDEALVLDAHSSAVRPYPKPLSLSRWSLSRLGLPLPADGREERPVAVPELGRASGGTDLHVRDVALLGRGPRGLVPHGRAATAAELLRHCFNHYRRPAEAFAVVGSVVEGARCWVLDVDDPVDAAELVGRTLR